MSETFTCGARERLVEYLYGEGEPDDRDLVAAHVAGCEECAGELSALSDTRALLAAWTPPEVSLGWQVPSGAPESALPAAGSDPWRRQSRTSWWRDPLPAWAQAAAAMLIFAAGLAAGASSRAPVPAPPVPVAAESDLRTVLASVERRVEAVERSTASQAAILAADRGAQEPAGALLRRVRAEITASEERMRGEFAMRLIQRMSEENQLQQLFSENVDAKLNSHARYVSQLMADQ